MTNKEFYQETFSQVQSSAEIRWEDIQKMKVHRRYPKRLFTLAAAVCLLAAFSAVAYAAGWFGLRDMELTEKVTESQPDGTEVTTEVPTGLISLQGFGEMPEKLAVEEWQAFLAAYDNGGVLQSLGNAPSGFEANYGFYQVYTQEMADKLEEILEKYSLKKHISMVDDLYTNEALCDQVGGDFLGENRAYSTYMYEDGTFKFDGEIDLAGYGTLDYQFMRCVRGSFTDVILNIGSAEEYTEWGYVTACGSPVTLALADHKALVIVDLLDSFVTINVLAGASTPKSDVFSSGPFVAEDLERFADSFDFSLLTPARPADPNLPRPSLAEVLGKPSEEEFILRTGVEEAEAQAFYADFLSLLENDDRRAVAESIHYPACVTVWNTSDSGTYLAEVPVASADEFLPYYDDIFTDGLWESINQNQYTMERADLITNDGMIGAAGGAIWFAPLEDGLVIFTIQNDEGGSIRQAGPAGVTAG